MSEFKDTATSVVKIATDILFVRNPIGTSMGTVFGIVLHGLVSLFTPLLQLIEAIKISSVSVFHFIALGIFGFNIKHLKNYHKVSPEIEEAITFIEVQQRKGNITKWDARQRYRELVSQAVENAHLNKTPKDTASIISGADK